MVKRLHEYKRQLLMNSLHIVTTYESISLRGDP
jgi:glucan phosphorylase